MADDENDAKLVERLIVHDERAFSELYRLYGPRIQGLVFRMIGSRAETEDITQQVFIKVFKAIGTFRGESKLSTWMYRIAVNEVKNRQKYLRVRNAEGERELEAALERVPMGDARREEASMTAPVTAPDDALAGKRLEEVLRQAIAKLDPVYRECVVLRDVEDLSYEEIVEITGQQLGTVKSRIFRGRAMLKEMVERALKERRR